MKKVLFIDRDGTLIKEPPIDFQVDAFEKLEFLPGVFYYLKKIVDEMDYVLVMVTNQDGLGTKSFPLETFTPVQNFIITAFKNEGIVFEDIFIDKSFEHENLPTRKPGTAMLSKYIYGNFDLENSYVIGDRLTDIELAKNLNAKSIFIKEDTNSMATFSVKTWKEIYEVLKGNARKSKVARKTKETSIEIELNLEGTGYSSINTGLKFFDHMLEQISKHGGIDLTINVQGDLEVDEHHTVEDTGLALGEAFIKALGSKKGIERYGFLLPMDESLAQVGIDFGGRPWLVWEASFTREKVGDVPTELFHHFFKSFSDTAKCNLNIQVKGDNEHHKIESIFKCFAKALKMAIAKTSSNDLPSTKGVL